MGTFLGWWSNQHYLIRFGVAFVLILVSTLFLLAGRIWPWGWVVGIIMLFIGGRSQSERNGYNF